MRRFAIYFFWDSEGNVRDFVTYYLSALRTVSEKILVVANEPLTQEARDKLLSVVDDVLVRPNQGFDVWAYKEAMEYVGYNTLASYDEVILSNFTCYGPVYPFTEMFGEMATRSCDFWGAVKHPEQPNYLLPNNVGYIYEHIMSYFIVIRQKMMASDVFAQYWKNIPPIHTKTESTALHETVFTRYFEQQGFISDAFVDLERYRGRCYNSSIILANELLIKDRCPLVKRRAFFFPPYQNLLDISDTRQTRELLSYIREQTDYDEGLIWQDILQTQDMGCVRNNMHLNQVISSIPPKNPSTTPVALLMSVADAYTLSCVTQAISAMPEKSIICLVAQDHNLAQCTQIKQDFPQYDIHVLTSSDASNIISHLHLFADILARTTYLCCLYPDTVQRILSITNEDYLNYYRSALLDNKAHVENILTMFDEQPYMGFACPPPPNFADYYYDTISDAEMRETYGALNLRVPYENRKRLSVGSSFWVKMDAIKTLMTDDFTQIRPSFLARFYPAIAQSNGYYSTWVMSPDTAATYVDCERYMQDHIGLAFAGGAPLSQSVNYAVSLRGISEHIYRSVRSQHEDAIVSFSKWKSCTKAYIKKKLSALIGVKNCSKLDKSKTFEGYAYVYNIFADDDGVLLFCMHQSRIDRAVTLRNNKGKIFEAKTKLTADEEGLRKHNESFGYVASFFFIPKSEMSEMTLDLYEGDARRCLVWAACFSYNSNELKAAYKLYTRIENGTLFLQKKSRYIKTVLRTGYYKPKDKLRFVLAWLNPYRPYTIFVENLGYGDCSFELFKYSLSKNRKSVFVVSQDVYDAEKSVDLKKHFVVRGSLRHQWLMFFSKRWITSFSLRSELMPMDGMLKDVHYNMLSAQWIFVPHGMAVGDKHPVMLHRYSWGGPYKTYASTPSEQNAYINLYDFKNVLTFGSPRMDKWYNAQIKDNEVFVFFTWRLSLMWYLNSGKFNNSDYFKTVVEVLNTIATQFPNYKITYAFHHDVTKKGLDSIIMDALSGLNIAFIKMDSSEGVNAFNEAFKRAKYLITDYSSVAYDFAYKDGAIPIYYMADDFVAGHYPVLPAFYDIHLGILTKNLDDLKAALTLTAPTPEMIVRKQKFFPHTDNNNTQRVYDNIFSGAKS